MTHHNQQMKKSRIAQDKVTSQMYIVYFYNFTTYIFIYSVLEISKMRSERETQHHT